MHWHRNLVITVITVITLIPANPANRVGVDRFGNVWSVLTRRDGTQIWGQPATVLFKTAA